MRAILKDHRAGEWYEYTECVEHIQVDAPEQLLPALSQVEAWVTQHSGWGAGWVSYDAAPGVIQNFLFKINTKAETKTKRQPRH